MGLLNSRSIAAGIAGLAGGLGEAAKLSWLEELKAKREAATKALEHQNKVDELNVEYGYRGKEVAAKETGDTEREKLKNTAEGERNAATNVKDVKVANIAAGAHKEAQKESDDRWMRRQDETERSNREREFQNKRRQLDSDLKAEQSAFEKSLEGTGKYALDANLKQTAVSEHMRQIAPQIVDRYVSDENERAILYKQYGIEGQTPGQSLIGPSTGGLLRQPSNMVERMGAGQNASTMQQPPPQAIQDLMQNHQQNPGLIDAFQQKYGGLPPGFDPSQ